MEIWVHNILTNDITLCESAGWQGESKRVLRWVTCCNLSASTRCDVLLRVVVMINVQTDDSVRNSLE